MGESVHASVKGGMKYNTGRLLMVYKSPSSPRGGTNTTMVRGTARNRIWARPCFPCHRNELQSCVYIYVPATAWFRLEREFVGRVVNYACDFVKRDAAQSLICVSDAGKRQIISLCRHCQED